MLRVNRIRIEIETSKGRYGIDEVLSDGLNFFASEDNTCGKSSILEAVYYGLGFEEIIGGKGDKVLTSAYKTFIEDGEEKLDVLESKIFLEISNGNEEITIYRTAKMNGRDSKLVTVYYSNFENISADSILVEDMYVSMPNAATNLKGFHRYLEKFLHLQLPIVSTADGKQRKLYLQLLFSCMFIEQKHGWGDIFSGMPYLGIKNAKKRVIEYVLKLDTFSNEKQKESLKNEARRIQQEWESNIRELYNVASREYCSVIGIPEYPCILEESNLFGCHILKDKINITEKIAELKKEYEGLEQIKPKVVDNFDLLQNELEEIEKDIQEFEGNLTWYRRQMHQEKAVIRVLNDNIEIIDNDLRNNKDAARLRELGAQIGCASSKGICPVCQQSIEDTLLPSIGDMEIMSIDENIRHLEAQKKMLLYAKESHEANKENMDEKIQSLSGEIIMFRRLAKAIRSDLYSVDEDVSEAVVYKRIELQNKIEKLSMLLNLLDDTKKNLLKLSKEWKEYLSNKEKLPDKKFTDNDSQKLGLLRKYFVYYIEKFGYKSVLNMRDINISEETYLPIIKKFDMKFDSSASDNVRGIWAYTLALMRTSIEKQGNHPNILIFDEPKQHSIIPEDMDKFLESIVELGKQCQIIVGITVKEVDTQNTIQKLDENTYKLINVKNKAFQKM